MTMALSPWRRWFGYAEKRDEPERQAESDERRRIRHDYRNRLHDVALKTEEARQLMDAIDVQVDYLRAARRDDDAKPTGDDPGGGVRGSDARDV